MIDRFLRLRHHAVVRRDDEDDDVRDPRTAGAHHRERLVTRCIEEHDVAVVDLHGVGTDVLRDAAGLALGDARGADRVEQRGLAVIDVAHDRHNRRAGDDVGRADVFGFDLQHLLFERLHLDVGAELARDHRCRVVVERAVDGHHHAALDQLAQDVLGLDVEFGCEIGDRHALGERDRPGNRWRRGW